ncbi:SDR family NAD(P)-dependent oxidoreductase [Kaistella flava (ex Peng et al. 2021)]|uniref:SDR family NAD(P)-dependent oxidoreductase n=1 Tax=Kaistella flava (ex Peng et al. 2021) TaxID=2038776 RepID=A0A7M2Y614_9FLAO|nr:SDR family NAD(P)-dependent oxidoreductase [Kaistella flava (ex Peng et al. 2021)]QOW09601.1 SDR family NAD(P)-dependent oxidoreductase [Kaistella flava (ex Peng et al. 2021)]
MENKSLLVIVGAGLGVSAGVARKFGTNGFKVILISRKQESLDLQIAELQKKNIEAHGIIADASVPESIISAFNQINSTYGNPDVLIYNAGANSINNPSVLTQNELLNDFKANVAGALISAQQVIPQMMERKKGTILFTGGMLALNPVPSRASASISKAGLRNLTFTLADELSPFGIHVATVTIGGVVKAGTFFDPDLIAEAYWNLYIKKDQKEILYKPA